MFEIETDNRSLFWVWSLGLGFCIACGFILNELTLAAAPIAVAFASWIFGREGSAIKEASRWVLGLGVILLIAVPFAAILLAFLYSFARYLT